MAAWEVRVPSARPGLPLGLPHELKHHAPLNRRQVGQSLAQLRAAGTGPEVSELERLELVGGLGAQLVLPDQQLDPGEEIGVLHHQDLRLEDARLLDPRPDQHPLAQRLQPLDRFAHGGVEAEDLRLQA